MVTFFTTSFFTGVVSYLFMYGELGIGPMSKDNATVDAGSRILRGI